MFNSAESQHIFFLMEPNNLCVQSSWEKHPFLTAFLAKHAFKNIYMQVFHNSHALINPRYYSLNASESPKDATDIIKNNILQVSP